MWRPLECLELRIEKDVARAARRRRTTVTGRTMIFQSSDADPNDPVFVRALEQLNPDVLVAVGRNGPCDLRAGLSDAQLPDYWLGVDASMPL